ncbi:hypothetical protein B0H19DRAFT_1076505 [Mycena capillaripes]|nr:hypothetical protein B0H19DRAFT_1076505 [Mycena capillaripes]
MCAASAKSGVSSWFQATAGQTEKKKLYIKRDVWQEIVVVVEEKNHSRHMITSQTIMNSKRLGKMVTADSKPVRGHSRLRRTHAKVGQSLLKWRRSGSCSARGQRCKPVLRGTDISEHYGLAPNDDRMDGPCARDTRTAKLIAIGRPPTHEGSGVRELHALLDIGNLLEARQGTNRPKDQKRQCHLVVRPLLRTACTIPSHLSANF